MNYLDLIPTHNELRNIRTFIFWSDMMKSRNFIKREKPALIIETEDSKKFIFDGHHYFCAAARNNIEFNVLDFKIEKFTYEQLNSFNWDCNFITPFNPRTSCRLHNLPKFKSVFLEKVSSCLITKEQAEYLIRKKQHLYSESRIVDNLFNLIGKAEEKIGYHLAGKTWAFYDDYTINWTVGVFHDREKAYRTLNSLNKWVEGLPKHKDYLELQSQIARMRNDIDPGFSFLGEIEYTIEEVELC